MTLAIALSMAGCAASSAPPRAEEGASTTVSARPTGSTDELPRTTPTTDGEPDATQATLRTGPIAQYGGPAYGDQGIEEVEPGFWCDTIVVFWGADDIPADVSFTFERAAADRRGLDIEPGVCGSKGATASCVGLVVTGVDGPTCSLVLRPRQDFAEGTIVTFTGTLRCPSVDVCDAVGARDVEPGPPIEVFTPSPVSS